MDCRRTLMPALWLLTGALGCATDKGGAVRETPPPPLATAKKEVDGPKRMPMAGTCVAAGNYCAEESKAADKGSTAQGQLRDKARRAYQQAILIDPAHLPAYQNLAHLYVEMEDYEHAAATYQKALQMQPRNAGLWFDLGMCQARFKDWSAALESLGRAAEFDSENRQYVNTLGFALARAGQYQASLACFCRVHSEAMANYQLARMLHHLKQDDLSRQCAQTALNKDPNLELAQTLLTQLGEARPAAAAPLRTVNYTEDDAAPAPAQRPAELPPEVYTERMAPVVPRTLPSPRGGDWQTAAPR